MRTFITLLFIFNYLLVNSQVFNESLKKINSNNIIFLQDSLSFNDELSYSDLEYLKFQKKLKSKGEIKFKKDTVPFSLLKKRQQIFRHLTLGDHNLYNNTPNDSISFEKYNLALNTSLKLKDSILITESLKKILYHLSKNRKNLSFLNNYLIIYKQYLYNDNEIATYKYFKEINRFNKDSINKSIKNLEIGLVIAKKSNNKLLIVKYLQFLGVLLSFNDSNTKNELDTYLEALNYIENTNIYSYQIEKFGLYVNIASVYSDKKNMFEALKYYNKADKIEIPSYRVIEKIKYNDLLSKSYLEQQKFKEAFIYLKKANNYREVLNEYKKEIALNDINTKYKTKEKEIENLQLKQDNFTSEAKRKQNQNLFYGALAILFFSGIIYYQNIKNSKRKRLLAEQQKELEQQKNITFLKEQEITTINAMVDGQEKERIRIAEDLHDNIGSVLATLKLHFENLKLNREKKHFNQDELYLKTEKLIDETYFKVRNLAHAKNAGVIANKGLLTAVKIMAEKISDANKITIEVLDFGLEKRLENSLELTIFRIIQELTTNIIKHAEAANATINLSLYDNNLNIIIEDNGKGFVLKETELKNDGMGLGSIKTRIKHLNGTFEVDSTLGKGASILINIPV